MLNRVLFLILALAWANPAWAADPTHYKAFTIAASQITGTLSSFPVLISEVDENFETIANGGCVSDDQGDDIRPYADSTYTTPLDYEMVPGTYVPTTGFFEMWVRVPSAQVGSVIYLFCGDTDLTADGSTTSTWDSDFMAVYHLQDSPTGGAPQHNDSTSSGHDLTVTTTAGTPANITGQVASGVNFPTSSQYNGSYAVSSGNIGAGSTRNYTISGWVYINNFLTSDETHNFILGVEAASNIAGGISLKPATSELEFGLYNGATFGSIWSTASSISTSTWIHVAGVDDGSNMRFYKNGSEVGNTGSGAIADGKASLDFLPGLGAFNRRVDARFDEVRFSDVTRSADWIAAEYNNQSNAVAFTDKGALTAFGGGGGVGAGLRQRVRTRL